MKSEKKTDWIKRLFSQVWQGILAWKELALIVFMVSLFAIAGTWIGHYAAAQEKSFVPTELETARLEIKLRDAQLAQGTYTQAQATFQQTVNDFNAEVEAIKKAHKWPADVQLDQTAIAKREIKFVKPAPPPTPPASPSKKP